MDYFVKRKKRNNSGHSSFSLFEPFNVWTAGRETFPPKTSSDSKKRTVHIVCNRIRPINRAAKSHQLAKPEKPKLKGEALLRLKAETLTILRVRSISSAKTNLESGIILKAKIMNLPKAENYAPERNERHYETRLLHPVALPLCLCTNLISRFGRLLAWNPRTTCTGF